MALSKSLRNALDSYGIFPHPGSWEPSSDWELDPWYIGGGMRLVPHTVRDDEVVLTDGKLD